jgi:hypothetical protein
MVAGWHSKHATPHVAAFRAFEAWFPEKGGWGHLRSRIQTTPFAPSRPPCWRISFPPEPKCCNSRPFGICQRASSCSILAPVGSLCASKGVSMVQMELSESESEDAPIPPSPETRPQRPEMLQHVAWHACCAIRQPCISWATIDDPCKHWEPMKSLG